jgi:ABC-type transport system involved in multi-copper enzyme maturation permease subunit
MIGVLTSIVLSTVIMSDSSANLTVLLGGIPPENAEMEFMSASMGAGAIYGLLGIIVMIFICNDYSSGFAKNIFSVHTNKRDYFISKLLTMMVASAIMLTVFVFETVIVGLIVGRSMAVDSIFGIVAFMFQKWLISGAFAAIYIFINVLTRNKAIGSVAAFLVGTGGLVMGLHLFFGIVGIDGSIITDSTIYGASSLFTAEFSLITTLRVLVTGAAWMVLYGWLSNKVLLKKDVV